MLLVAGMALLAACDRPPGYLERDEAELGVGRGFLGNNRRPYHAALWQPQGLGLRGPGYVVGVEELAPSAEILAKLDGELVEGRRETHAITHIMRTPRARLRLTGRQKPKRVAHSIHG